METEVKLIKLVLGLHCHAGLQKRPHLHACKTTVGYEICETDLEERVNFVKL
jgi:hypothetical protein